MQTDRPSDSAGDRKRKLKCSPTHEQNDRRSVENVCDGGDSQDGKSCRPASTLHAKNATQEDRSCVENAASPHETPPTSNSPDQTSDSCASRPSHSPMGIVPGSSDEAQAGTNEEQQAGVRTLVDHSFREEIKCLAASRDEGKSGFLRIARSDNNAILLPPLLPSPASPAPHATSSEAPAARASLSQSNDVCTKETKDKDRVGGLDWGERRRKNVLDKAYSGYEGFPRGQQVARLRQTVARLQNALPADSKTTLLTVIRRYTSGELTPEDLAESIKTLVDQHNVVIPLQDAPTSSGVGESGAPASRLVSKREAGSRGAEGGGPSGKKHKETCRTSSAGRKSCKRKEEEKVKEEEEEAEDTSAWEALLSVCTMKGMRQ